mmetsp:Transcript_40243/g.107854  ORF Transcript_40243/g.107854 Transcript_40243/m.107854 type:complete len:208 (-) Transcript_40243:1427-2050(-)
MPLQYGLVVLLVVPPRVFGVVHQRHVQALARVLLGRLDVEYEGLAVAVIIVVVGEVVVVPARCLAHRIRRALPLDLFARTPSVRREHQRVAVGRANLFAGRTIVASVCQNLFESSTPRLALSPHNLRLAATTTTTAAVRRSFGVARVGTRPVWILVVLVVVVVPQLQQLQLQLHTNLGLVRPSNLFVKAAVSMALRITLSHTITNVR